MAGWLEDGYIRMFLRKKLLFDDNTRNRSKFDLENE
jgi:hypothetical protein